MSDDAPIGPEPTLPTSPDVPEPVGNDEMSPPRDRGPLAYLVFWTALCVVSAAPSLGIAWHTYDRAGILTGIAAFIALYTLLSVSDCGRRIRRNPVLRVPMAVAYILRAAVSIIFPAGLFIDLFTGFASVSTVQSVFGEDRSFLPTFITTLVQAILMHVILLVVFLLALPLGFRARRKQLLRISSCQRCDYDLRGSAGSAVCPECGTPIPRSLHAHLDRLLRSEKPASD